MSASVAENAIEILHLTRDGDALAPTHLKLVECAVNGRLNEKGLAQFNALLENARKGYAPPWLHGIEHLTIDHEGYVRWKGNVIEHFSSAFVSTVKAASYTRELGRRCTLLEQQAITPSTTEVVWRWKDA